MNRAKLSNIVDELTGKMHEAEGVRDAARQDIATLVEQAITTGEKDFKKYSASEAMINLHEMILAELHSRQKAARLDLWQHDLEKASEALGTAYEKWAKAKADLKQAVTDKADYLRGVGRNALIDENTEHLSSLDILIVDCRACENVASRNRNIARRQLADLKAGFNEQASELGAERFPEKETQYLY